jgi:hypothetical protein
MTTTADYAAVVHRLPGADRVALVRPFVGHYVTVIFDNWRDGKDLHELEGELLAVARPYHSGPQSHVLALRTAEGDLAVTIACVREVRTR